jgi:Ca-activated chloride channel homolog
LTPSRTAAYTRLEGVPRDPESLASFESMITLRQVPLVLVILALLAWPISLSSQEPGEQMPTTLFKAGVEMVSLNVTVTDPAGRYVTDLTRDEMAVYEDGVKQDLEFFSRTNFPVSLAFLIDTSSSMEEKLLTAQEAAIGFARRLRPEDQAEVVDFDSRVEVLQGFTNSIPSLERAIRRTAAGGSTSLYNALYVSLKELRKTQVNPAQEVRRQAVILLSDGEDTSSLVSFDEVLELARRSETTIYCIGLMSPDANPSRGFREANFALRQFSQQTGGRAFFPTDIKVLASTYGQIFEELSSQYTVGYTSKNPRQDGAWRRVVVRVSRPNVTARTKEGYYGPTGR